MSSNHQNSPKPLEAMTCPICQNPVDKTFAPFCSKACKNIDLIRWFKEDYRIPTQEPATNDDGTDTEEP